jgi:hypothetical protein
MITTLKNIHGTPIHFKLDNGKILIHHEYCSRSFISFEDLLTGKLIDDKLLNDPEEILLIVNTAKLLKYHG